MTKLTKEQAVVITAYTGFLLGSFNDVHHYIEKLMGRPVFTHEMGSKEFMDKLRRKAQADFIALSPI